MDQSEELDKSGEVDLTSDRLDDLANLVADYGDMDGETNPNPIPGGGDDPGSGVDVFVTDEYVRAMTGGYSEVASAKKRYPLSLTCSVVLSVRVSSYPREAQWRFPLATLARKWLCGHVILCVVASPLGVECGPSCLYTSVPIVVRNGKEGSLEYVVVVTNLYSLYFCFSLILLVFILYKRPSLVPEVTSLMRMVVTVGEQGREPLQVARDTAASECSTYPVVTGTDWWRVDYRERCVVAGMKCEDWRNRTD